MRRNILALFVWLVLVFHSNTDLCAASAADEQRPLTGIIDIGFAEFGGELNHVNFALDKYGTVWYWQGNGPAKRGPNVPGATAVTICANPSVSIQDLNIPGLVGENIKDGDINQDLAVLYNDSSVEQFYFGDNIHYGSYLFKLPESNKVSSLSENSISSNRGSLFMLATDGSVWLGGWGALEKLSERSSFKAIDAGAEYQLNALALDSGGQVSAMAQNSKNS